MVARHPGAAFDRLREEAVQESSLRKTGLDELFVGGRTNAKLRLRWDREKLVGWRNFFLVVDRLFHWAERVHIRPLRKVAIRRKQRSGSWNAWR